MRAHVADAELHRLDLQMQHLRAVGRKPDDVEALENAERDQRRDALAVRRQLVDAVAEEFDVDRLDPVARVRGEILRRDVAAVARRLARDRLRELAAIEALAAALGELLQRRRMMGRPKMLAGGRRAAMRQERLGEARLRMQPLDLVAPDHRNGGRDQKSVARIADRRLEEVGEAAAGRIAC